MPEQRIKYPSTPHLPWDPSPHKPTRYVRDMRVLRESDAVVVTEKMDGESLSIYPDGTWHARSLDTPYHPTRTWAARVAGQVAWNIPDGWRLSCENLYAEHSVRYDDLRSHVQLFGAWRPDGSAASWGEVLALAAVTGLPAVPVLYEGPYDEDLFSSWTHADVCEMAGRHAEGYVLRTDAGFPREDFGLHVAKWVRENHVQTDEHWLRRWTRDGRINTLAPETGAG